MFEEPEVDGARKEALKRILNEQSRAELLRWLEALDPAGASRLPPEAGRQRLARLIEIVLLTGRTLHWWQTHSPPPAAPTRALTFVLELDRETLYRRINERVIAMIESGLAQEVASLLARGYDENTPGMKTTGYIELIPYVRGEGSLESAADAIQRASRSYARRQITWFRHQLAEPVVRLDAARARDEIVETIVTHWQTHHANRN
jgi:tRNA dimethylallyltransferase